jgi:hypothetical protein
MYMQEIQKPKLKTAAPIFKLRQLSQAVPVGRTVKVSINTLTIEKAAG